MRGKNFTIYICFFLILFTVSIICVTASLIRATIKPVQPAESLVEIDETTTESVSTTNTSTNTTTGTKNTTTNSSTIVETSTKTSTEFTQFTDITQFTWFTEKEKQEVITKATEKIVEVITKENNLTAIPVNIPETVIETTTTKTEIVSDKTYIKEFEGTYYTGYKGCMGGSGRELISCSSLNDGVIGSVACRYIYDHYGYSYNGKRTTVYLEVPGFDELNGLYYVDDCCASSNTIDFYFTYASHCPFELIGRIYGIKCYIID